MRVEIRIAGTGGMGVVLAGVIIGHAAVVHGGLDAVQTQSYGSEARGTDAKSEVIVSDQPIHYPKVQKADYSVLMSQKAFDAHASGAKARSTIIIDSDLVDSGRTQTEYDIVGVKAMRIADDLGQRMVSNMVMLGALIKKSRVFPLEILEKAVAEMVPAKSLDVNLQAVRAGAAQV
jgi:2-oxoglutarate ferredoxin oxidoreductase subunit gamma